MSGSVNFIEQTRHRWPGILATFGLGGRTLSGKHGPCPLCGGKDRFRFDNKNGSGSWFCNGCGSGYGIHLVVRLLKTDLAHAMRAVEQVAGIERQRPDVARQPIEPIPVVLSAAYEHWVERDDRVDQFEERAAILEYDGGYGREQAEARALQEIGQVKPMRQVWRDEAHRRWPNAVWLLGDGRYATVARCGNSVSVMLHVTKQMAKEAKEFIDRCGCGADCIASDGPARFRYQHARNRHLIVDLGEPADQPSQKGQLAKVRRNGDTARSRETNGAAKGSA